jgi:integrase
MMPSGFTELVGHVPVYVERIPEVLDSVLGAFDQTSRWHWRCNKADAMTLPDGPCACRGGMTAMSGRRVVPDWVPRHRKKQQAADVLCHLREQGQVLPRRLTEFLKRVLKQIYPRSLKDVPEESTLEAIRESFSLVMPQFRQGLFEKLSSLEPVLDIHQDVLEAARASVAYTPEDELFASVYKALGTKPTENHLTLAQALGELKELSGKSELEQCGDISLFEAQCYCWSGRLASDNARGPATLRSLLGHTGFKHSEALDEVWPRLQCMAVRCRDLHTGPFPERLRQYFRLADAFGKEPKEACHTACVQDLALALESVPRDAGRSVWCGPFLLLKEELTQAGRASVLEDLKRLLRPELTRQSNFDWLYSQSPWHAEMLDKMMEQVHESSEKSHFKKQYTQLMKGQLGVLLAALQAFASEHYAAALQASGLAPLQWILENFTADMVKSCLRALLATMKVHPDRVKAQCGTHNAKGRAFHLVKYVKTCIAPLCVNDMSSLTAQSLLKGLPSKRIQPEDEIRRTYTDEEISAMFEACESDARWSLILRILREIGLRVSALGHLKYHMLLDAAHTPRHVCKVPEKGGKFRHFITSFPLKQAIKRYAELLHDSVPADGDMFLFNTCDPAKPLNGCTIRTCLTNIARAAGVKDVKVHPHAFRHTIVGNLIDAGNSMDKVSKWMGHSSADVTATHYHVPEIKDLHEKMNNPFTGQFQQKMKESEDLQRELELVYDKRDAAVQLFNQLVGCLRVSAAQNASAAYALKRFELAVPNAQLILAGIIESTSASMSDMQDGQPDPAGGIKKEHASLQSIEESSVGSSSTTTSDAQGTESSENESPQPACKRAKLMQAWDCSGPDGCGSPH